MVILGQRGEVRRWRPRRDHDRALAATLDGERRTHGFQATVVALPDRLVAALDPLELSRRDPSLRVGAGAAGPARCPVREPPGRRAGRPPAPPPAPRNATDVARRPRALPGRARPGRGRRYSSSGRQWRRSGRGRARRARLRRRDHAPERDLADRLEGVGIKEADQAELSFDIARALAPAREREPTLAGRERPSGHMRDLHPRSRPCAQSYRIDADEGLLFRVVPDDAEEGQPLQRAHAPEAGRTPQQAERPPPRRWPRAPSPTLNQNVPEPERFVFRPPQAHPATPGSSLRPPTSLGLLPLSLPIRTLSAGVGAEAHIAPPPPPDPVLASLSQAGASEARVAPVRTPRHGVTPSPRS